MSIIIYDLVFMVLFTIAAVFFLYKRRHKLKRQGWIFLYHTKRGTQFMDTLAKRYHKILVPMQYVIVATGYALMAVVVWMMAVITWQYISIPEIVQTIRAPPLAPLIPYFPEIFGLESYFPPFYFTYFLVAIAFVAVFHEFAHGIYMRVHKIRIKSTGFAFFGPFFGAFVEQDDKQMNKAKKFPQLVILAAGTFANVVLTVIFAIMLWAFFAASFAPAGVNFNAYPFTQANISGIDSVNGMMIGSLEEIPGIVGESNEYFRVMINGEEYLVNGQNLKRSVEGEAERIIVFEDAPAINAGLKSPILSIDGKTITSAEMLREEIRSKEPGQVIEVVSIEDGERVSYDIELAERDGNAYLGIATIPPAQGGISGAAYSAISIVRNPELYYEPVYNADLAWFIYYLIWWLVVVNILVALFNMLPLGMLDGGRFFYLTIWGITGSEKIGKKAYTFATWFILGLLALLMVWWVISFI